MHLVSTSAHQPLERSARSVIGPIHSSSDHKWRVAVTPFAIEANAIVPPGTVNHVFESEQAAETFAALIRVRHADRTTS